MSWFGKVSLPNITTSDKYYYIPEVCDKDFFCIHYAETVKVHSGEISTPKRGVSIIAIPKEEINGINPAKDFTINVTVNVKGKEYKFSKFPLSKVLTNDTLIYPEYLTSTILSCGEQSIGFNEEILIVPGMLIIPKFTDLKIMDKLNEALNKAFWNTCHSSQFTLESSIENPEFHINVNIELSSDVISKLKEKSVGPFVLPELKEAAKVSNSSDLLVKSVIADKAAQVNRDEH